MLAESNNPFDLVRDGSSAADTGKTALRLLVIDDDSLHRMVICRAAAKAGYLPAGAATCDEAAKMIRETAFDCITLDLGLGDRAGSEAYAIASLLAIRDFDEMREVTPPHHHDIGRRDRSDPCDSVLERNS